MSPVTNRNANSHAHRPSPGRPSEDGYMLVAVLFLMAAMVIALAAAAPRIKDEIRRDREVETMQRGKQYIRAVQLYYRKFHAYPPNMDALVKTQEIRFLRKKYIDPTTGKEEWKTIAFGQNKAPTAMGFFGQPIGGSSIAGIGPSGGNGLQGANGTSPQGGTGLGATNTTGQPNQTVTSTFFDANGSGSSFVTNGAANARGNASADPSGGSAAGSAAGGPGNGFGGTFGGAGIIGFSPQSPKDSILVYKKKTHYNEWEFVYDPLADQAAAGSSGAGSGAQPLPGATPTPGINPQTPTPAPTLTPTPPPAQTPPPQQ